MAIALLLATLATGSHGCDTAERAAVDAAVAGPDAPRAAPDATADDAGTPAAPAPIVILLIGDGMGRGQRDAAAHQRPLAMTTLPHHGDVVTASLSGITDSAAAATAMSTGVLTRNAHVGVDAAGEPVENLFELAARRGLGTGVVTTASLSHATPAAFTAHHVSRHDYEIIATQQIASGVDVALGGGMSHLAPHLPALQARGYALATDRDELAARATSADRLMGIFAAEHLDYVRDRAGDSPQPTLPEMTAAALTVLERSHAGFFLVVEGARIDMAGHGNDIDHTIDETLAFDDTVALVRDWAASRPEVSIIVTADHETGGLDAGDYPEVRWRWGQHTNARVDVFAAGPLTDGLHAATVDHRQLHALLAARLLDRPPLAPPAILVPDGRLGDLEHLAATQLVASGFGAGFNRLDGLRLGADDEVLALGVEGVFQWQRNAVVVLIDVDHGNASGIRDFDGAITDHQGRADRVLAGLRVAAPDDAPGFGADLALVVWGGSDPQREALIADAGLRRLDQVDDLGWLGVAVNFGEGVRAGPQAASGTAGEGLEAHLPWTALYPGGVVPDDATVALAVVLVNDDGGYLSNQSLPAWPAGTDNPGRAAVALPDVVTYPVGAASARPAPSARAVPGARR